MVIVAVFDALFARSRPAQLTAQITFQGLTHTAGCAGGGLNAELLEELDCSASHPTAQHDVGFLFINEARNLTRLVAFVKGVIDHLYRFDIPVGQVDDSEVGAAAKMMRHCTIQSIIGFN